MSSKSALMSVCGKSSGYYDLNISAATLASTTLQKVLDRAALLGYTCVAVNVSWCPDSGCGDSTTIKVKRRKISADLPDLSSVKFTAPVCKSTGVPLIVLTRLTVKLTDGTPMHILNRPEIKKFDLFAVTPTSPGSFSNACLSMMVDIISVHSELLSRSMLTVNLYRIAMRRGVVFELNYAPVIVAQAAARRAVFAAGFLLASLHSAKGILISSGATHENHLRAPYDVPSLGYLLSVPEKLARASISTLAHSTVVRAYGRVHLCGRAIMVQLNNADSHSQDDRLLQPGNTDSTAIASVARQ